MNRLATLIIIAVAASVAMANAGLKTTFNTTYAVKPASNLGKAGCKVCHAGGAKLNKYGTDLKAAKGSGAYSAATLKSIEGKDSDGDGKTNGVEIKADSNPGA